MKELDAAADSEGHGKWTETKKYLASLRLTGRRTECNLGGEKRKKHHFMEMTSKISIQRTGVSLFCVRCETLAAFFYVVLKCTL